jgi:hypothetical protein
MKKITMKKNVFYMIQKTDINMQNKKKQNI